MAFCANCVNKRSFPHYFCTNCLALYCQLHTQSSSPSGKESSSELCLVCNKPTLIATREYQENFGKQMYAELIKLRETSTLFTQTIRSRNQRMARLNTYRELGLSSFPEVDLFLSSAERKLAELYNHNINLIRDFVTRTASFLSALETPHRPPLPGLHIAEGLRSSSNLEIAKLVNRVKMNCQSLVSGFQDIDKQLEVLSYHSENLKTLSNFHRSNNEGILAVVPNLRISTHLFPVNGTLILTNLRIIACNPDKKHLISHDLPTFVPNHLHNSTLYGVTLLASLSGSNWKIRASNDILRVISDYFKQYNDDQAKFESPSHAILSSSSRVPLELKTLRQALDGYLDSFHDLLINGLSVRFQQLNDPDKYEDVSKALSPVLNDEEEMAQMQRRHSKHINVSDVFEHESYTDRQSYTGVRGDNALMNDMLTPHDRAEDRRRGRENAVKREKDFEDMWNLPK